MRSSRPRRQLAAFLVSALFLYGPPATASAPGNAASVAAEPSIDEIVVTADFRGRDAADVPASVSIIDAAAVDALAVQHFEELVAAVPNLNWSGDGHRARYFQIRGVGELEQYEGAPNPSVGFLIDDIDFSGIGTIGTLFDIERVEVLRGSQGSRYGANALAGLVYMRSAAPTAAREGRLQLTAGSDDAYSAGIALGGSLRNDDRARYRLSVHRHSADGFRTNRYLGRSDTNGRDETTLRGRLYAEPSESVDLNIALLYADVDNGYDAFALDNSLDVLSDKPGRDAQRSVGMSVRLDWLAPGQLTVTSISSMAESDIRFGFDADWGNEESWAPVTYDYTSASERRRRSLSQEIRLVSDDDGRLEWLAGLYAQRLSEDLLSVNRGEYYDPFFDFADNLDESLSSAYDANSVAAFGQVDLGLGPSTVVGGGLRIERRSVSYDDSTGLNAGPSETMVGGELTLSHAHSDDYSSYLSLSRSYKAGGFNLGAVPAGRREFGAEGLWNLEAGIKAALRDDAIRVSAAVFLSRRDDQQVRTSFQLVPGDPASFVFFTDNAAVGKTFGAEADVRWTIDDAWQLYASLGLLDATFDDFVSTGVDLAGREQAHAPRYTIAAGAAYRHPSGWFARLDASGKGSFYFDVSHDRKSEAYELVNARVGFDWRGWTAELWARNLLDARYAVRGFFFGNEPPDFPLKLYTRLGDPRQLGVTIERRF